MSSDLDEHAPPVGQLPTEGDHVNSIGAVNATSAVSSPTGEPAASSAPAAEQEAAPTQLYRLHDPAMLVFSERCPDFCISFCCISCLACQHRMDVLGSRWPAEYHCCQNAFQRIHPKCVFCEPCAASCPTACLCLESYFCSGLAVTGSRFQLSNDLRRDDRLFERHCGWVLALLELCVCPGPWSLVSRVLSSFLLIQQDHEMRMHDIPSNLCYVGVPPQSPRQSEATPLLSSKRSVNAPPPDKTRYQ